MANIERIAERYSQVIPTGTRFKVLYNHPTESGPSGCLIVKCMLGIMEENYELCVFGTTKNEDPLKSYRPFPVRVRGLFVTGKHVCTIIGTYDFSSIIEDQDVKKFRRLQGKWVVFEGYNVHTRCCPVSFEEVD